MSQEPMFWSQRDAAREYPRISSVCETLFETIGALAPHLGPASAVVAATPLARHLGAHAEAWRELVPESVLLEDDRAAAPSSPPVDRSLVGVVAAVESLRSELAELLTRTSPVADAPARRQAEATIADIDRSLANLKESTTTTNR